MARNMLHIVRGLPGTGKSSFVQKQLGGMLQIENDQVWIDPEGKYNYIEGDQSRELVRDYTKHMVTAAMQKKVNLAVSRVNMSERSVRELVELAKAFDYDFKIWLMDKNNTNMFSNVHNVPDKSIAFMTEHFDHILPWEQTVVTTAPCFSGYCYKFTQLKGKENT